MAERSGTRRPHLSVKVHKTSDTEMSPSPDITFASPRTNNLVRNGFYGKHSPPGAPMYKVNRSGTVGSGVTIPVDFPTPHWGGELDQSRIGYDAFHSKQEGRLVNPEDGSYTVEIVGNLTGRFARDMFHTVIGSPWWKLLALMVILYLAGFILFGLIYYLGRDGLNLLIGSPETIAEPATFLDCVYFSVQVFHAIGFGIADPNNHFINWVVLFHVIYAYIFNAVTIGIIFARFSRGTLRSSTILFSRVACVTPSDETHDPTLCVRVMNLRKHQLLSVSFGMLVIQDKTRLGKGHKITPLKVQTPKFPLLALPWTIKHKIDADSPLHNFNSDDLARHHTEIIVYLEGVDETSGQMVQAKRSYLPDEIIDGRFDVAVRVNDEGYHIVTIDKFDNVVGEFEEEKLPFSP